VRGISRNGKIHRKKYLGGSSATSRVKRAVYRTGTKEPQNPACRSGVVRAQRMSGDTVARARLPFVAGCFAVRGQRGNGRDYGC